MTTAERQHELIGYLQSHGQTAVAELADRFGVSDITIRRDLATMSSRGLVRRTHGGAVSIATRGAELPIDVRRHQNRNIKSSLATAALDHIRDGDTVALDSGTTTEALAGQLTGRSLTVMPLSVPLMTKLCVDGGPTVVLPGGLVRPPEGVIVGPLAVASMSRLRFDVGVVSTCAIDDSGYIMAHDLDDAEIKRTIISLSDRVVLLTESWKFMRRASASVGSLAEVDVIVTDDDLAESSRSLIGRIAPAVNVVRVTTD